MKRKRKEFSKAKKKIKQQTQNELDQSYLSSSAENECESQMQENESVQTLDALDEYNGCKNILKRAHGAHAGVCGTALNLRNISFPGKNNLVKKYVGNCIECKGKNVPKKNAMKIHNVNHVADKIAVDSFCSDDKIGFVAVEVLSNYTIILECETKSSVNALKCLLRLISVVGLPNSVLTDNGKEFQGEFGKFLKSANITVQKTVPGHPSSNPAERRILEIKKLISAYTDSSFEYIEVLLNHQRSDNSGYSPAEIITGMEDLGVLCENDKKYLTVTERERIIAQVLSKRQGRLDKKNKYLRKNEFMTGEKVQVFKSRGDIEKRNIFGKKIHNAYLVDLGGNEAIVNADLLMKIPSERRDFHQGECEDITNIGNAETEAKSGAVPDIQ